MFRTPATTLSRISRQARQILPAITRNMSDSAPEPTGLIATKGIELLTFGTPNGHKASIILEELKEAYGMNYTWQSIDITKNTQKEPWYTKICPNGRIPAIVDHDRQDFAVFEGLAILSYLTRHYDPEHKFSFVDPDDNSRVEQISAFQHGGVGPMQGQSNHFFRLAKERIPYPTQRYVGETERLYGVLDKLLEGRDYFVGPGKGKYSTADIAVFSWVNMAYFAGVDLSFFKNLNTWADKINQRPAVKKGTAIPSESKLVNPAYQERLKTEEGFAEKEQELKKLADNAKKQYDYKYTSP